MRAVRPENVVLELCRSRVGMLDDGGGASGQGEAGGAGGQEGAGEMAIGGEGAGAAAAAAAIRRSLALGGGAAVLLRAAMGASADALAERAGRRAGGEFRAAVSPRPHH